jgi:hypothetical protein
MIFALPDDEGNVLTFQEATDGAAQPVMLSKINGKTIEDPGDLRELTFDSYITITLCGELARMNGYYSHYNEDKVYEYIDHLHGKYEDRLNIQNLFYEVDTDTHNHLVQLLIDGYQEAHNEKVDIVHKAVFWAWEEDMTIKQMLEIEYESGYRFEHSDYYEVEIITEDELEERNRDYAEMLLDDYMYDVPDHMQNYINKEAFIEDYMEEPGNEIKHEGEFKGTDLYVIEL